MFGVLDGGCAADGGGNGVLVPVSSYAGNCSRSAAGRPPEAPLPLSRATSSA